MVGAWVRLVTRGIVPGPCNRTAQAAPLLAAHVRNLCAKPFRFR